MTYEEYRRAEMFFDARQYTEAARRLTPLVEAEPSNRALVELLARSHFHSAQLTRAEATLRHLITLAPDHGWAYEALARTLERSGHPKQAAAQRRIAQALGTDPAPTVEATITAANLIT